MYRLLPSMSDPGLKLQAAAVCLSMVPSGAAARSRADTLEDAMRQIKALEARMNEAEARMNYADAALLAQGTWMVAQQEQLQVSWWRRGGGGGGARGGAATPPVGGGGRGPPPPPPPGRSGGRMPPAVRVLGQPLLLPLPHPTPSHIGPLTTCMVARPGPGCRQPSSFPMWPASPPRGAWRARRWRQPHRCWRLARLCR